MKNVYIEGLGLVETHFSGVGQYISGILRGLDELLEELKLQGKSTPNIRAVIPYDRVKRFKEFGLKNIGYKTFPIPFRYMSALDHRGKLPPIDLWCGPGFYIFTRFAAMPLIFSKYANVVYDLSFELYDQFSDENNAKFLKPRTRNAVKGAEKVITISQNAKKEIIHFYNTDPSKVIVATPAVDQSYIYRRDEKEIEKTKQKYGIKGKYLLSLSNLEPRKNLDGLVDAYCLLPKSIRDKYALLLVGVNGWKTEELFNKIIGKVREGYNIIRPSNYISDRDKASILSGAEMLVYPSHYEGFGMPPLEALACGTPVVCSNNSSLPEAVGECSAMIESTDINGIRDAILKVIDDKKLKKDTLELGPRQAERFSWKKSAKEYYNLIIENI